MTTIFGVTFDNQTALIVGLAALVVYKFVSSGDGPALSKPSIPTQQDIIRWVILNKGLVFILYTAGAFYLYSFAGLPDPRRGVVFYGYLTSVFTYPAAQKAFGYLDFSTSHILRPVDPRDDRHRPPWKLSDEYFADLDVWGADELKPQRSPWGTVYNVLMYDPERNVAVAAPEAAADPEELVADRSKIDEIYSKLSKVARKYQVFLRIYPSLLLRDVKEVQEEVSQATQKGMFPGNVREGRSIDDELGKIALDEEERDDDDRDDEIAQTLEDIEDDRLKELDGDDARALLTELSKEAKNGHGE